MPNRPPISGTLPNGAPRYETLLEGYAYSFNIVPISQHKHLVLDIVKIYNYL